jgi:hypothetical protein
MPKVEWLQVAGGLMSDSMRLYFGAAMALALSACIPVPNAGMRLAMRSADTIEAAQTLAARGNTAWPPDQWWRLAGDPQLTALDRRGLGQFTAGIGGHGAHSQGRSRSPTGRSRADADDWSRC